MEKALDVESVEDAMSGKVNDIKVVGDGDSLLLLTSSNLDFY